MHSVLTFDRPEWFWAVFGLPAVLLACWRSRANLGEIRWAGVAGLRCAVFLCLIAILAEPQYVRRSDGVTVIFALDRSRSIPDELRRQAEAYVKASVQKAKPDDRYGIVSFDGRAQVDAVPRASGSDWFTFSPGSDPDRSNLAAAVRMATALFPPDTSRRIILLTDGNQNKGNVLTEVESATANGAAVDVIPLAYEATDEMLLDRLVAPARTSPNSRIHLRIVARSLGPARARLAVYHNGTAIPLENPTVELKGGLRPEVLTVPVELISAGVHRFEAILSPEPGSTDTLVENNRAGAFTLVESRNRVLVLGEVGSTDDQRLVDALKRESVEVDYRRLDEFSVDPLSLQQYTTVFLGNISADSFTDEQHKALASYVRDLGGGLILLGGDNAFGAGGWIGRPVEEVSPVDFRIPSKKILPVAALIIVLDHSGSMSSSVGGTHRTQQQIANEAAILAMKTLLPQDYLGLVAFDTQPAWVVPLQRYANPTEIAGRVRGIGPGGGTDAYPALEAAVTALEQVGTAASVKHVLLLTDGQTQPAPFEQLVQRMVRGHMTLSTIGVGDGMNDPMLRRLAELGGGVFHPVRDARTLPQIFFRETRIFRNRLISEEPFMPQVAAPFSPLLAGASGPLPELGGFVLTRPKPDAMVALVHPKEGPGAPVLAGWHYEMGKSVAFTSGLWRQWGAQWASWESFGGFWKAVVEWAGGDREAEGLDVLTRLEGTTGQVIVEAVDANGAYLNMLQIDGVLLTPRVETRRIRLSQTGPGRYEARFPAEESGEYLISLRSRGAPQATGVIRTGLTAPYSPEYRQLRSNAALLEQVVEKGRGKTRWLSVNDNPFERDLPPVLSRRPVWKWMIGWCLLPLLISDVAVRRLASMPALSIYLEAALLAMLVGLVRLTDSGAPSYMAALVAAGAVGWPMRWRWFKSAVHDYFTSAVAPAPRAEAMARLDRSKRRVREDNSDAVSERRPLGPPARFDAESQADFMKTDPQRATPVQTDAPIDVSPASRKRPPSSAPTTSRLLNVKKRLLEEMNTPDPDEGADGAQDGE